MSTITLPNIRVGSDLQVRVRLKDGGVAIDWSTLQNIKACIYSDAQRALAGRCAFSIDEEDNTLLVCTYAANKPQYLGVNRIVISAKYMGETKTYDKPAFNFVRWTADQEGEEITIDDPDVDVEIDVEDVSSSILQEAVDAAFSAADRANEAAAAAEHMVDIHTGPEGKSAYEVAVEEGYTGTEEEWLASLKGDTGETPDISIGTVTTVEPGTPAAASMTGTPEAPVLNLSIPQGVVGATPNFTVGTVTTGEPGSSVIVTITGTPEAPVLNVTIPQGMQGNTGSSVDYPYELVNNLTTNDSTKGLSAAQGVVLDGKVSQLEAEVTDLEDKTETTIVHNKNLADSASEINGFLSSSGTFTAPSSGEKSIKFPCKPSTTYTISKVVTSRFRVAYFKNEPSAGVQGAGTITQNSASSITITTAADSTYIVAFVYNGSSESKTMEEIMASLQIEVGSTATEYVAPGWTAVDKIARENNTTIWGRIETIEESVSNNSEDISELQDAVLPSVSGVDSASVNTGKYRTITGELADSTAYFYTDPIRLYKGDKIIITSADIVVSCSVISLLDANGDYVSTIYAGQGETASYTYTAQEDVLVELSAPNSKMGCFAIDRNGILGRLSLDEGRIENLENTIQDKTFGLDGVQVTTGAYRNSDGTISSLNGYYYTEPIKLHKGDSVFTDISIPTLSVVAYVTEVDSLGNFVSVLKAGSGEDETISVTIEKDCYVSISSPNSRRGNFFFTRNGLSTRMDNLSEGGTEDTIDPATKLPAIGENPLSTIRRDAGYGSIIRKWGIIGDSLSSGEMQCYNEESASSSDYKFIDMYQYSTGQVFARLIGADAYNFSNGGQTTWGWLKSQGIVRDETYIGGVGGGDWRLAQQSEYIKDGYIIALGVNDRGKINNNDYELGNTTQITEYDGTNSDIDDTTTYPKSFVRYYAGIIQRILSVQPKAKIFCVTPLGDNYAEIAQAIRDIVTYFGGNVYLMDIREYIPDGYDVAGFKLQGHLSPMGYAYWAYMYNTYIDWIIRNNGNAFRDTALIGTDYRPDYS